MIDYFIFHKHMQVDDAFTVTGKFIISCIALHIALLLFLASRGRDSSNGLPGSVIHDRMHQAIYGVDNEGDHSQPQPGHCPLSGILSHTRHGACQANQRKGTNSVDQES